MTAEELVKEIKSKVTELDKTSSEVKTLLKQLSDVDKDAWDWVSVKKAADTIGVSVNCIYNRVNNGTLSVRHIDSKTLVLMSEVKAIDDKYEVAV